MAIDFHIPLRFLLLIPCVIGLVQDASAANFSAERPNVAFQETYQYTSTPTDDRSSPNQESVTMMYHRVDDRVECLSRTVDENFTEGIAVTLLKGGNVISAKMERTSNTDRDFLRKSLIRADNRWFM